MTASLFPSLRYNRFRRALAMLLALTMALAASPVMAAAPDAMFAPTSLQICEDGLTSPDTVADPAGMPESVDGFDADDDVTLRRLSFRLSPEAVSAAVTRSPVSHDAPRGLAPPLPERPPRA